MTAQINFDNTYARDLPGFYAELAPAVVPAPALVILNDDLAKQLSLDPAWLGSADGIAVLGGNAVPEGAAPLAQAYAGHQFGGFSPQLGDGRAILLGEIIDADGQRFDLQLKGSGRTPFSRSGDGKAGLGPVLREYIMGEAMHGLGIPTTRALAAVTTGETVMRETPQRGAVLTRVAASHIRVGTFQFFAARGMTKEIGMLADYAISRHDTDLRDAPGRHLAFLQRVMARQARLIAQWMGAGFIHGVMNTDNMTISGETIDYGPCAFMDAYDSATVFSSIDQQGRYAYGNQPGIAKWNLARLAETLLPLLHDDQDKAVEIATEAVNAFGEIYAAAWAEVFSRKIGFASANDATATLAQELLEVMAAANLDFTNGFLALSGGADDLPATWVDAWQNELDAQDIAPDAAKRVMQAANPAYIPRNHLVEEALAAANDDDLAPMQELLKVLENPYQARAGLEKFQAPAPSDFGPYVTYCGT